ncbi:phosphatidylglycerophosphatase A family protein [Rhodospira trueperi]|nr:phosphatidylglycerophosphatase A [Rhodospira trueperi]
MAAPRFVEGLFEKAVSLSNRPTVTPPPAPPGPAVRWLATWFGSGLSPIAPGTAGSLAALPFAWGLNGWGGPWLLLAGALAVFALGIGVSDAYGRAVGRRDPAEVVIDEVAGQWLTLGLVLLVFPWDAVSLTLGFLAFRVADIVKPWPARQIDRTTHGGVGIMADDMVAGVYAAAAVLLGLTALEIWIVAP